jgi:hypothetical protein
MSDTTFTIGPGNDYWQAFNAALAGHQIRMPDWPTDLSWVFERNHQELMSVRGISLGEWQRSGAIVCPTGRHQLFKYWEVLPIIDHQAPIV